MPDDFPWHLFVSFVGPHDPFDPPTEYGERYRRTQMPAPIAGGLEGKPHHVQQRQVEATEEQIAVCRRQYCAAIELIDDQVGHLLAVLKQRGMAENTFIFFTSDHGEMLGDHGFFTKSVAYDPSMRVPLLCNGPGIEAGGVSPALVELIDLNATICQLAGLSPQEGIDARSFAPLLRGQGDEHREEVLTSLGHFRCVRTRRWKYIDNAGDEAELYDMEADSQERDNLAGEEREVVQQMAQRLQARWLEGQGRR